MSISLLGLYQNCGPKGSPFSIQQTGNTGLSSTGELSISNLVFSQSSYSPGVALGASANVSSSSSTQCQWSILNGQTLVTSYTSAVTAGSCSLPSGATAPQLPSGSTSIIFTLSVTASNSANQTALISGPFLVATTPVPTPVLTPPPPPTPAPTPVAPLFAIGCGDDPGYTGPTGIVWSADRYFSGGAKNGPTASMGPANAPNGDGKVYWYNRGGNSTYTFTVPAGMRTVILKFAEYYHNGSGQRVFNVSINGVPKLNNFDIYASAGGKGIAVDEPFTVNSTGTITISFTTITDQAQINGILIY